MPEVPVYVLLGADNAEGDNIGSELLPSFPQYSGPQTGFKIWNHVGVAYETYEAGDNSAPESTTNAQHFGPEVSMLAGLQALNPTQPNIYLVKVAVFGSSMAPQAGASNEWFSSASELWTAATARITAAMGNVPLGFTARLKGVFWVQGEADGAVDKCEVHEDMLATMIDRLRATYNEPYLPFVMARLHNSHPLSEPNKTYMVKVRQAQELVSRRHPYNVLISTDSLSLKGDLIHFDVRGSINLGTALVDGITAAGQAPMSGDGPAADAVPFFILLGSENALGGAPLAGLPSYLSGSQTGVKIWNPTAGTFQDLLAGTNNLSAAASFGPEMSLGHALRDKENATIYLVKLAVSGSSMTPRIGTTNDWCPPSLELFSDLMTRVDAALAWIASNLLSPVELGGVFVVLGETDSADDDASSLYQGYLTALVAHLRNEASLRNLVADKTKLPVVVAKTSKNLSAEFRERVRAAQQAVYEHDPYVAVLDTDTFALQNGLTLFDAPSTVLLGKGMVEELVNGLSTEVRPTFLRNLTELRAALRLSGMPTDGDGQALLSQAVLSVRAGFYRRLQQPRIDEIKSWAVTTQPSSDQEYLRQLANITEVLWVRKELMRTMPTLFQDSAPVQQTWNDEAIFRSRRRHELQEELNRLDADIENNLEMLGGGETAGNETSVLQGSTIEDDDPDDLPGGSVWDELRR